MLLASGMRRNIGNAASHGQTVLKRLVQASSLTLVSAFCLCAFGAILESTHSGAVAAESTESDAAAPTLKYEQPQAQPVPVESAGSTAQSSESVPGGMQEAASGEQKEPHSHMLQGEVGALGRYENPEPPAMQRPSAAPQSFYGQAGAPGRFQQPFYGQAQMPGQFQQQPYYGQANMGPPYQPLYGQATGEQRPPFFGQAGQAAFAPPLQGTAYSNSPPTYQSSINHGQMTIGVLGAEFGMLNNQIRQILPGSDLLRYGITPGDIIEAADGQPLRGKAMQAYIRGTPGTYVQLTILHGGQLVTIPVQRKDTREFSSYDSYFRKWAAKEKFW